MSFTEVLAELPALAVAERQLLISRALDLDDPALRWKTRPWWKSVWRIIARIPIQPCRSTK